MYFCISLFLWQEGGCLEELKIQLCIACEFLLFIIIIIYFWKEACVVH